MQDPMKKFDAKEIELPDTLFVRDIESSVFQSIVLEVLARIEGVSLIEGNIIDTLLGRDLTDRAKGIHIEQEEKQPSVRVKVEVNIAYGISLTEKAEEIQTRVSREISRLTGLHVSCVHVVFKSIISSLEGKDGKVLKEKLSNDKARYTAEF